MEREVIGECFGNYRATRLIGRGSMGEVFEARHNVLGKPAAVKILRDDRSSNPEAVHRFAIEARAVAGLQHPGLVQIYDFGYCASGEAYIVMELLEGRTLSDLVDSGGALPVDEVLRFGRQIAQAMALAHEADIVHRDLKPENLVIVIDEAHETQVKILDFGVAKVANLLTGSPSHTRQGELLGTPAFMSPEQCRGSAEVDARADIYALGCVLYYMLTGRPPFNGHGVGEVLGAHLYETPPAPATLRASIPPEVDAVIMRLLEKQPDNRPWSMEEVDALLGSLQDLHELSAPPLFATPPATVQVVPAPLLASASFAPTVASARTHQPVRRWLVAVAATGVLAGIMSWHTGRDVSELLGEAGAAPLLIGRDRAEDPDQAVARGRARAAEQEPSFEGPPAEPANPADAKVIQAVADVTAVAETMAQRPAKVGKPAARSGAAKPPASTQPAARPAIDRSGKNDARKDEARRTPSGQAEPRRAKPARAVSSRSVGDGALDPYRD